MGPRAAEEPRAQVSSSSPAIKSIARNEMTKHKQLKALRRHKRIVKETNMQRHSRHKEF